MSSIKENAQQFFDACESGGGWEACARYCHEGATFASQAGVLSDIDSLEGYTNWMAGMLTPLPDGDYELKCLGVDEDRGSVSAVGVFRGTHTGPGGPVEPTGKCFEADYVYHMQFDGDRIRHMTKVWNDAHSLQQLGWA